MADAVVFYADLGFSPGMKAAWRHANQYANRIEIRDFGLTDEQRKAICAELVELVFTSSVASPRR